MDNKFEISDNVIKKAMVAIAQEVEGVTEIKQASFKEEAGQLLLELSINIQMGTMVRLCAEQLQKHVTTRFKELLNVEVQSVNIAIKNMV